jgi:hypothetical protein
VGELAGESSGCGSSVSGEAAMSGVTDGESRRSSLLSTESAPDEAWWSIDTCNDSIQPGEEGSTSESGTQDGAATQPVTDPGRCRS